MSGIVLLLIAIVVLLVGYVCYGGWLVKQWGIDPARKTPAFELEDGVDYCPAKAPVLLGHHFASIAGAGPINGPIQAAYFGWLPCLLWILLGGIFIGAVQDFSALFVSIRNKGKSIGEVLEVSLSHKCKMMFSVFTWLVMLLVDAAFADIVAKTFAPSTGGSGSVAMASLLFIPMAIAFGFAVYRKHAPLLISSVVGVIVLALCVAGGIVFPLVIDNVTFWRVVVFIYCAIASVTPVWILLQPRDYLNSFLLYFMIICAVIGIFGANPDIQLPAFIGWKLNGTYLFPTLFITIACGAVSGFHSLIASGTTSKQISNEKDAKMIGYGGMLIECVLAVISLICVGNLTSDGAYAAIGTPAVVFATGVKTFFETMGMGAQAAEISYTVICLAVSAFCLTSLDTCCRLGRFTLQEMFQPKAGAQPTGLQTALQNKYVSTIVNLAFAGLLVVAGYDKIWPLFGAANQMVAVPALMAAAVFLKKIGKGYKMFIVPMFFMALASMSSLVLTLIARVQAIVGGGLDATTMFTDVLQSVIIVPMLVLAILLLIDGCKYIFANHEVEAA